jgi:hypothetical protein
MVSSAILPPFVVITFCKTSKVEDLHLSALEFGGGQENAEGSSASSIFH